VVYCGFSRTEPAPPSTVTRSPVRSLRLPSTVFMTQGIPSSRATMAPPSCVRRAGASSRCSCVARVHTTQLRLRACVEDIDAAFVTAALSERHCGVRVDSVVIAIPPLLGDEVNRPIGYFARWKMRSKDLSRQREGVAYPNC
jgi:hypothetical protein